MHGLLYTATGPSYVDQALVSIESARRWNPGIPIAVFTDSPEAFAPWTDQVTTIVPRRTGPEQKMLTRLESLLRSPFERTLALDTDTVILGSITEVFSVLDRASVAICHGHQRTTRYRAALQDQKARPEIPYGFSPMQGGVILFDDAEGRAFAGRVISLYREKQYEDDQVSMREALWDANHRFVTLAPEYNIYRLEELDDWASTNFEVAVPKIFHTVALKQFLEPREIDDLLLPIAQQASAGAAGPLVAASLEAQRPASLTRRVRIAVGRRRRRRQLLRRIQRSSR